MESNTFSKIFVTNLIAEVRRRLFEESFNRIRQCLSTLTEEQIWVRPNEVSNSVGHLVLHICGNTTQWLISGLGDMPDHRNRSTEFDPNQNETKKVLLDKIDWVEQQVNPILTKISAANLIQIYNVQVFQESGMSMLIHVTEHTSYHTGQITYLTKLMTGQETNYYGNLDLEAKNKGPV
ncbi:MAG: DUF1572 family protein [Saprospiraceae bacterium]|nr:DUF1572 family protein [Saprospiraceae bacterium]